MNPCSSSGSYASFFALLLFLWGITSLIPNIGFTHEGAHPDPSASPIPIHDIALDGKLTYSDGTPVTKTDIQLQWIIEGSELFAQGAGQCPRTAPHMTGVKFANQTPGNRGEFSTVLKTGEIQSMAAPSCLAQGVHLSQIQNVRLRATLLATDKTCQGYCKSQPDAPDADDSCVRQCSSGQRILEASTTLSPSDLQSAASNSANGALKFTRHLVVTRLGPTLSESLGVDLRVSGEAAQSSLQQVEEIFAPDACEIQQKCVRAAGVRKLMRFDGVIENIGTSDLNIGAVDGNPLFDTELEVDACHGHAHFKGMVIHQLLTPGTLEPVRVQGSEVVSYKQGFCMMDSIQINASSQDSAKFDCDNQGLTAGWSDIYSSDLECQYLDVTDVAPGSYILRLTVNPQYLFDEGNVMNNTADVPVTIR